MVVNSCGEEKALRNGAIVARSSLEQRASGAKVQMDFQIRL